MRLSTNIYNDDKLVETSNIFTVEDIEKIKKFDLWNPLHVSDFDDTICSRRIPLSKEGLKNNRWDKWYYYVIALYSWIIKDNYVSEVTAEIIKEVDKLPDLKRLKAVKEYVKEFYWKEDWEDILWHVWNIDEILVKTEDITNVILTAWIEELQELKVKFSWLSKYPKVIVKSGEEKIKALVEYIKDSLWYIPSEIVINEDKPEFFLKYWKILADVLWVKIIVNTIVIDEENIANTVEINTFSPDIKSVK